MNLTNITNYDNIRDYDKTTSTKKTLSNSTNNEKNIEIVITLITIIPCGMSLVCLISVMVYTLIKPLIRKKIKYSLVMNMDKYLYPNHPVRHIITGPSECGKSVFLTNLFLNSINEYDKINIYSPSLCQDLYQNLIKGFSIYIPIHIIPYFLNEEDIDLVIDEVINNKDFEKSDTEIETYEPTEESKFPQEYENNDIIILDDLNQKEMYDPRVQAMFKRSRHNNLINFTVSQGYYELGEKTKRCNGNIYHIFKPNNFTDVQNLHQDKASIDMTLNECKYLTSTWWNEKNLPLTIDMTKDRYQACYRLGLNSIFIPDSSRF